MWTQIVKWARNDPITASKLQRMAREIAASRQWRVTGDCLFKQTPSGQALHITGGGGSFSGTAYTPAGVRYTGLTDGTKPWVKYDLSTNAITEETGPPSEPWGASEIWRKKSDFRGAIYF